MLAKLDRQDRFRIPAPDENRRDEDLEDRAKSGPMTKLLLTIVYCKDGQTDQQR